MFANFASKCEGEMFAQMWLFAHVTAPQTVIGNKRNTDQWASTKHHMEGVFFLYSSISGRKNQAKYENDYISRNGHGLKITQPNWKIFVSFFSVEDALSNDAKNNTFSSQGTENPPFRFFWDTRYRMSRILMRSCHDGKGEMQLSDTSQFACSDGKQRAKYLESVENVKV